MEWISGNILIRPNGPYPKGKVVLGHAHNFDHTTIAFKGAFVVREVNGGLRETTIRAPGNHNDPSHLLISGGVFHEIVALEADSIFWCVYAHRAPQGDVVQKYIGWRPAYETTTDLRPE